MGSKMGTNHFILFIKEKSMILKKKLRKKTKLAANPKRRTSYKFSNKRRFYRENLYLIMMYIVHMQFIGSFS